MTRHLVVPDDYALSCRSLPFLFDQAACATTVLGDLARTPDATDALARADALILIRERTWVDDAFLARCPRLRLISQTGKLARNVDLAACSRAGVAVVEGSGDATAPAELAWLLMMAARRQFVAAVGDLYGGHWQRHVGHVMRGATLGILGFGKIGKLLAGYARAFGMDVVVWGSERARAEALQLGLRAAPSRAAFFAGCDIVSVHQRLVDATAGNVTLDDLSAMKPDALFVNTSRAELVAPGALQAALDAGRPGYAALDVFEHEPLYDPAHPLLQRPNVLCSPHLGYTEHASLHHYLSVALQQAQLYWNGERGHVLNPDALAHPRQQEAHA